MSNYPLKYLKEPLIIIPIDVIDAQQLQELKNLLHNNGYKEHSHKFDQAKSLIINVSYFNKMASKTSLQIGQYWLNPISYLDRLNNTNPNDYLIPYEHKDCFVDILKGLLLEIYNDKKVKEMI